MGRGLGATQRLILDAATLHGPYCLSALAGGDMTTRYKSLHRAAVKLQDAGLIEIRGYAFGRPRVVITPIGHPELGDRGAIKKKSSRVAAWAEARLSK